MNQKPAPSEGQSSEQTASLATSDDAACSPSSAREPLRRAYSREELASAMAEWMVEMWGHPMELTEESRDRWMERNGMLYAFICDHFPAANAEVRHGAKDADLD